MKKPKAQRRALRAKKYEQKLISKLSFTDLAEATTSHAHKLEKIKASKKGMKIASVGIQTIYNDEVSKIQPMRDTLRFIAH